MSEASCLSDYPNWSTTRLSHPLAAFVRGERRRCTSGRDITAMRAGLRELDIEVVTTTNQRATA